MSGSEEEEIAKWLQQKGATKCPPRAARELGETSPGWRREVERKAERTDKGRARHQKSLQVRGGLGDEKTKR